MRITTDASRETAPAGSGPFTPAASRADRTGDVGDSDGDRPGLLLDRALDEAGIKRQDAYVTNVVKHFKWEVRGKIRLHKKPSAGEAAACQPWLPPEIEAVKPGVVGLSRRHLGAGVLGARHFASLSGRASSSAA
jgi:uracil-DNA glycosylase family 4